MSNKFTFICPIFDAETRFDHCLKVRESVFYGKKLESRRGCQACVAGCRCPVAMELNQHIYNRVSLAPYESETPKKGKLRLEVLRKILPIRIVENHFQRYNVPASEQELIQNCTKRIEEQMKTAPSFALEPIGDRTPKREVRRRPENERVVIRKHIADIEMPDEPRVEQKSEKRQINTAAVTGDMSAAINS